MKVARKYPSGVELQQAYIDILLRLAGYRLSDLYTSILAHSSFYGNLDKTTKELIANQHETSVQVVSNGITKLRKLGVLAGNKVNQKLLPGKTKEVSLTLILGIVDPSGKSTSQENQPSNQSLASN